jgi:hypothetical protein
MTKKSLLLVAALAAFSLPFASAKSYDITLSGPTMVGTAQLPAGEYTVKVEGSNAVFTNADNDKSFTAPIKIENADKKYDETSIETTQEGDARHIQDIRLGGSTTKLDFD